MEPPPSLPSADPGWAWIITGQPWRFVVWLRVTLILAGLGLIAALAVARTLEPSTSGYGTHQQMGLPPCQFWDSFGFRCPACGMTTSWSHLTRGQIPSALAANAGGTLLGLIAAVAGPWLIASGIRGRWVGGYPHEFVIIAVCCGVTLVIFAEWALRLCGVV